MRKKRQKSGRLFYFILLLLTDRTGFTVTIKKALVVCSRDEIQRVGKDGDIHIEILECRGKMYSCLFGFFFNHVIC